MSARSISPSPMIGAAIAVVAAATTWVSTLAWRGFTEDTHRFLLPLAALGALVAGIGALLRWWRTPGPLVVVAQVVVTGLTACGFITGSLLPIGGGWDALRTAFTDAQVSAVSFAPPVPAEAPGVFPYLIVGGLGCLLLVDVIACTMRHAPLAGLPLLTVYSVPVGMLGISLVWWVFALTALGYLLMLHLEQSERVRRWGRTLDGTGSGPPRSSAPRSGLALARLQAGAIGGGVTALAVIVPLAIPTMSVQLLDIGRGPGGDEDIKVVNPTADLRRDLQRGRDIALIRVSTNDPDPDYLRIATLTRFSRAEWSSGDRDIPSEQLADGVLPPLQGVAPTVERTSYTYDLQATDSFDSTWLPATSTATEISALGDWRYDLATMDFISGDDDLTTAGIDWTFSADNLDLDATALAGAGSPVGQVSSDYLDLPTGISSYVRNLSEEVTSAAPTPYEKAVALQNWFRESGGFTYDLSVNLETSSDDLVRFLNPADGGRTGYCEQFASAMAVMARQLGIPARVAVGFLEPDQTGPGTFEYSSHDLHAWPELFFPGGGWVRFEPTPQSRAPQVPGYTTDSVVPEDPTAVDAPAGANPDEELPRDAQSTAPQAPEVADAASDDAGALAWWPWMVGAAVMLLLAGVGAAPAFVRRRRRTRHRGGDIELAWAELRDTSIDLGLAWPSSRSPRETGAALARAISGGTLGPPSDPTVLTRLVERLERSRYSLGSRLDSDDLTADLDLVLAAMEAAVSPGARRRATLLPRSVFRRNSDRDRLRDDQAAGPRGEQASESLADLERV